MELIDHICVILPTNTAMCALNKEIIDLFNKESISGACSGRANLTKSPTANV